MSTMTGPNGFLGVTPPISVAPPTPRDLEVTKTLLAELKQRGQYEGVEEGRHREMVLGRLNTLVKQFVYKSSLNHGFSEQKARDSGGKIFTFGSYRLGVHGPGADIDTLLVVPKHVSRDEFFDLFEGMLRETEGVTEVSAVPDAFVPIIKCAVEGIEIDFLFARLMLPAIPDDLLLRDDGLLRNLDERCVRSLGGSRVTDEILRLVPDVPVFREALRTVKLWAKSRAIYSNVMGFCGGVAWAMLVARICQLYPKGCAGSIISRFFIIMGQWQWPQPILLKPIEEGPLQVRVWNPKLYPSDRSHRMPIITPAYPSMCSTHNVTLSTQSIMTAEFKRAAEIVDRVFVGSATWAELFAPHDFFSKYRYYLQITASSGSADVQLKWAGTVEHRLRQLVMKLEYVDTLVLAHPFIKGFDRINYCVDEVEQRAVSIGEVPTAVASRTETDLVEGQGGTVYTTSFYIGLMIERRPAVGNGPRKLDISYPTNEFTKMVKMWDKYDADTMGVIVRYIKSSALPSYVHEGREPQTPKVGGLKRAKSKPAGTGSASTATTASSAPAVSTVTAQDTVLDDDSERLNKKLRSSSFVPEGSTPLPGLSTTGTPEPPMPPQPAQSEAAALAAAQLATSGNVPGSNAQLAPPPSSSSTETGGTLSDESGTPVPAEGVANGGHGDSTNGSSEPQQQGRETTVQPDEGVNGSLPGLTSVSA